MMIQKLVIIIFLWFSIIIFSCRSGSHAAEFNLGFEKITLNEKLPDQWFNWGSGYDLIIDTVEKKKGKASMRIQPDGEVNQYDVGSIGYAIPSNFAGKTIELQCYMKLLNVTDGSAGLALFASDTTGATLASENNLKENIQGTSDWALYSIKLSCPENTKTIFVAAMLNGKGQLWVDDFRLFMDGKEIKRPDQFRKIEYEADMDKEFDAGSGVSSFHLSESQIKDLVVLGKIWGFLKYYHPAIANGEYNWDYELFRILPRVLVAKNEKERNDILLSWANHLGKYKEDTENIEMKGDIKIAPELAWIDSPVLGGHLNSKLSDIRKALRTENHYYIGLAPFVGNPVFKNERPYSTMKYPDTGYRLLSLYRYWNIIEYYFPYKNLIEENWGDVLKEFIPKFINAPNELEYKKVVLALIGRVHDTHANIWGQDSLLRNYKGINYAPVALTFVGDSAVVKEYYNEELGKLSGLEAGDIIESINQVPVKEIIREKLPFTPASNYPTQLRDIASNLLRTNDTLLILGCKRDDIPFIKQIKCYGIGQVNPYKKFIERDTCFKFIDKDIAYLYPGSVKNQYLPDIMSQVSKVKGLIIDLRCYPSDFIVFSLSEYLQPDQTGFVKFSTGSITSPGLFTMTDILKVGRKNDDYYKGKIVILVNEQTQSNAEYTTMALRTAPGAVVIGSTTAGADGNVSNFYLPGGINTMISGIGVYYPDGKETHRVGIVPDIEVKPTIKGIKKGRDEVLERAVEIINGQ